MLREYICKQSRELYPGSACFVCRGCALFPFFAFEEEVGECPYGYYYSPCCEIAVFPFCFGHVLEVHSPDADKERQRDEYRGDYREPLHYVVHPQIVVGDVQVGERRYGVAALFYEPGCIEQMVVYVVEEGTVVFANQSGVGAEQPGVLVFHRYYGALQLGVAHALFLKFCS